MLDTVLRFKNTGSSSCPFETTLERYVVKSAADKCGASSFVKISSGSKSRELLVSIVDSSFPSMLSSHAFDSLDKKNLFLASSTSAFAVLCSFKMSSSVSFSLVPD